MKSNKIKKGMKNPSQAYHYMISKARKSLLSHDFTADGIKILDAEWDTLIILDCCRFDTFKEKSKFSGTLSKKRSLGSVTADFVRRNFSNRSAHDLVYLSSNAMVGECAQCLDVYKFVGMWENIGGPRSGQEASGELIESDKVVKKSLKLHEQFPKKRHIVHLLPPHTPHRIKDGSPLSDHSPYRNYEAARSGGVKVSEMRDVYRENLSYLLNNVKPLIEEVNGKKVITADHGELLGEGMPFYMKLLQDRWGNQWGKYDFGHYSDVDVPELVEVPWFEIPGEDRETVAEAPIRDEVDTASIEKKLKALGYR